ncbi:MAG TPA: gamma-glutamyl-gamma-aminobutyrate hydrolase family protein [Thermoleophilaceae bacterium]|jgi:putative glutamine amidotransferase|nr:gamma-glutamyl-gamma-aminobutyrate hydrolase family protein [Thermoleophilaceae bacterium]
MGRPVIGICAAIERARWGAWDTVVLLSPRNYSLAVQREGAIALILSPDGAVADDPAQLLDMLDGLILAGGSDVDPGTYGADPHPETHGTNEERDRFEVALARAGLERDMPVLGICRGMQMLNVACGGTLDQHLDDLRTHRHTPGVFCDHEVELEPGSLAAEAAGTERVSVKSHHHQGVAAIGQGVRVSGRNPGDAIVEAIEIPDRSFALGVLWHPEQDEQSRVIAALVEHSRANRHSHDPIDVVREAAR